VPRVVLRASRSPCCRLIRRVCISNHLAAALVPCVHACASHSPRCRLICRIHGASCSPHCCLICRFHGASCSPRCRPICRFHGASCSPRCRLICRFHGVSRSPIERPVANPCLSFSPSWHHLTVSSAVAPGAGPCASRAPFAVAPIVSMRILQVSQVRVYQVHHQPGCKAIRILLPLMLLQWHVPACILLPLTVEPPVAVFGSCSCLPVQALSLLQPPWCPVTPATPMVPYHCPNN